jgi:hypothetical protein
MKWFGETAASATSLFFQIVLRSSPVGQFEIVIVSADRPATLANTKSRPFSSFFFHLSTSS